jgi:hypothetical protein
MDRIAQGLNHLILMVALNIVLAAVALILLL